jgi:transcriptional regulator with XRE-family HTH domain
MNMKDELRALRVNNTGLTLRQTAKMLGLSPAYISDLENGHRDVTPALLAKYHEYNFMDRAKYSELVYRVTVKCKMPQAVKDYLTENESDVIAYINKEGGSANG